MAIKSLENLPNEIIIKNVLVHLSSKDVLSFGMTGNDRFKELTKKVIKKRGTTKRRILEDMKKDPLMEFFNLSVEFKPMIIKTGKDTSLKSNYFWS